MNEKLKVTENEALNKTDVSSSFLDCEKVYTNRNIRNWWLAKTEEDRRFMVRDYFYEGNSEGVNTLYGIMPEELEEIYIKNNDEKHSDNENMMLVEVSWDERKKYGYLGKYIVNKDIYQYIPKSWNQKPKLETAKGTIIEVVQYKDKNVYKEQFHTKDRWFKRNDITPVR